MRTEENCVILEGGDNLFRYNLGRETIQILNIHQQNLEGKIRLEHFSFMIKI